MTKAIVQWNEHEAWWEVVIPHYDGMHLAHFKAQDDDRAEAFRRGWNEGYACGFQEGLDDKNLLSSLCDLCDAVDSVCNSDSLSSTLEPHARTVLELALQRARLAA